MDSLFVILFLEILSNMMMELFWRVGDPKRKNQKLTGVCLGVCFGLNKIRIVVLNDGRDKRIKVGSYSLASFRHIIYVKNIGKKEEKKYRNW